MSRNNGKTRLLPMDAETKRRHLAAVYETVEAIPGVAKGFGRNPTHMIGDDGRKRAVCDLYVVFEDERVLEADRISTSPSSILRAVEGFVRDTAKRKAYKQILPPGKDPQEMAAQLLGTINPEYRIETWLPVGVNRYARYGNEYETPYCYHDLLQVSHPELGLSPFVEFETLVRFDPPRDPFTELRRIIEAHRLVHETYQERAVMAGFSIEKGRSSVQIVVADKDGRAKVKVSRLMQSVRAHARDSRRLSRRVPFRSPRSAGGILVGILDVDLPGTGPAIKVSKTSRSSALIHRSFLDRGYNFHVRGVLRYATFEDEKAAREFDRQVLAATAQWKIEVPPEIQGNTEFRDYYQLTRVDEVFRAVRQACLTGGPATPMALQAPGHKKRQEMTKNIELPLDEAFGDEVVYCLVCGESFRTLARHILAAHQMTPAQYREMFLVSDEVPLTARNYSRLRRAIASKRERS